MIWRSCWIVSTRNCILLVPLGIERSLVVERSLVESWTKVFGRKGSVKPSGALFHPYVHCVTSLHNCNGTSHYGSRRSLINSLSLSLSLSLCLSAHLSISPYVCLSVPLSLSAVSLSMSAVSISLSLSLSLSLFLKS